MMASGNNLPGYLKMLLQAQAYDHPAENIQLLQTHISYVVLAGQYVYKFKKPVNFGFLDFSSLAQREHYCREELRLNQRLCPDIYLDVVTINEEANTVGLNGPGAVVEYGVKMRRLPEQSMMTNVIARGELNTSHIQQLVQILVPFYERADRGRDIDRFGSCAQVATNVLENTDQIEPFIAEANLDSEAFAAIKAWNRAFLRRSDLFDQRIADGHIRDCHGDLHSGNICLDTPIHIFDCIEFNQRFRYGDVACDIAFLAMDLDFHGLQRLSTLFVESLVEQSNDPGILQVLNFYKCYRACVLVKVALLSAGTDDPALKQRCQLRASRYLELAQTYLAAEGN